MEDEYDMQHSWEKREVRKKFWSEKEDRRTKV
jgi:hypothetical protein